MTKIPQENEKEIKPSFLNFLNMQTRHWIALLTFFGFGSFLIWISKTFSFFLSKKKTENMLKKIIKIV
jgi:hypothetical protein